MLKRIRNRISQAIELHGADRIAKEISKGKLQAILTWNPDEEPQYQLAIKRPTGTSIMLTLTGYEEDVTDDGKILLCPILNDSPVTKAAKSINDKAELGESLWSLTHETFQRGAKPTHTFRIELAPMQSTAVYIALESETGNSEGDQMVMYLAKTHRGDDLIR